MKLQALSINSNTNSHMTFRAKEKPTTRVQKMPQSPLKIVNSKSGAKSLKNFYRNAIFATALTTSTLFTTLFNSCSPDKEIQEIEAASDSNTLKKAVIGNGRTRTVTFSPDIITKLDTTQQPQALKNLMNFFNDLGINATLANPQTSIETSKLKDGAIIQVSYEDSTESRVLTYNDELSNEKIVFDEIITQKKEVTPPFSQTLHERLWLLPDKTELRAERKFILNEGTDYAQWYDMDDVALRKVAQSTTKSARRSSVLSANAGTSYIQDLVDAIGRRTRAKYIYPNSANSITLKNNMGEIITLSNFKVLVKNSLAKL